MGNVTNGPSSEADGHDALGCKSAFFHSFIMYTVFVIVRERHSGVVQIPRGADARKKGWKDVVRISLY